MGQEAERPYSLEQGRELVKAARYVIDSVASTNKFSRWIAEERLGRFGQKHGVFVTIEHYPTKALRGCIGYPLPERPIKQTLVDAAIAAATEDPRFVPVSHMELNHILVEVNVLSSPVKIKASTPESLKRQIKIGRDGLIIRYGYNSGLLLPIVAVEEDWNSDEFLENLCIKAGLPTTKWKNGQVHIEKFTSQVFRETSPQDGVEEIMLAKAISR